MLKRLYHYRRTSHVVAYVVATLFCGAQVLAVEHLHEPDSHDPGIPEQFCSLCGYSDSGLGLPSAVAAPKANAGIGAAYLQIPSTPLVLRSFEFRPVRAPPAS